MMPNLRRLYYLFTVFFIAVMTFACASYPDDPREPSVGNDSYTIEEDTFLVITADNGILANDIPREGEHNYIVEVNGQEAVKGEQVILSLDGGKLVLELDGSFTYEPKKDFYGTDHLSYKVRNEKGKEGEGTCSIDVIPVNDPPLAIDDELNISTSPHQSIDVLANDVDPDGDNIRIAHIGDLKNGTAAISGDGTTILFTPAAGHMGDVSFRYTVMDEYNEEAQAWVLLKDGNDENNLVLADTITASEDDSVTLPFARLLENDNVDDDVDIMFGPAQNGQIQVIANRRFTYTPNPNFTGTDYFTYTVEPREGTTASATVTVIVTPVTDAPTIEDIPNQWTDIGQTLGPILFAVTDVDVLQTELEVTSIVSEAAPLDLISEENISIVGSGASRAMWITPSPDLVGTATIMITVSNGRAESSDSFQLTVGPAGMAPSITIEGDFSPIIAANTSLTINFQIQDPDTPINTLSVSAKSETPSVVPNNNRHLDIQGGNNQNGQRSITITPADDQTGHARVILSVSDGANRTDLPLQLEVNPGFPVTATQENSHPTETGPTTSIQVGSNQNVIISAELGNGAEPTDLNPGTANDPMVFNAIHDGNISFGENVYFRTTEDTALVVEKERGLLTNHINGSNIEMKSISPFIEDSYFGGEVKIESNGSFCYTPPLNFSGRDSFQYTLNPLDRRDAALSRVAVILVNEVNDPPLPQNDLYGALPGSTLTIKAAQGVLANDRDAEDQPLEVIPQNTGGLRLNADGSFTYRAKEDFIGKDIFNYTLTDGGKRSIATLTLVVGNDQIPIARADAYLVEGGKEFHCGNGQGLLANDWEPGGMPLFIYETGIFDTLFGGEVNVGMDGAFSYQPPPNFNGFDSFAYRITNGRTPLSQVAIISVSP